MGAGGAGRGGPQSGPSVSRREIQWDRDRWLLNHFYPAVDAAELTMPEFVQALNTMQYVADELRAKSPEEIVSMMAQQAQQAAQRRALSKGNL